MGLACYKQPMSQTRFDARSFDAHRPIEIITGFQKNPEGSVLYQTGGTRVLISASIEEKVPSWLKGQGKGWISAEYAMHPRANPSRQDRDGRKGRVDGRSQEIQRLISRSLRAAVHLEKMGEAMITVDCDVLDADGGTRTASITGGFIALVLALDVLKKKGQVKRGVLRGPVAAISSGFVAGKALLDLVYEEDSTATVDLNVVAGAKDTLIEVQGTAEGEPVPKSVFDTLVNLGIGSMPSLMKHQEAALQKAGVNLADFIGE